MKYVVRRLRATARREQYWKLLGNTGTTVAASSILLFLILSAEAAFHFSVSVRTTLWYAWTGLTGLMTLWFILPTVLRLAGLLRMPTTLDVAHRVGKVLPEVRDTLVNALQLFEHPTGSPDLISEAVREAEHNVQSTDFSVIINKKLQRRAALWGVLAAGLLASVLAVFPDSFGAAFQRFYTYDKSYMPPAPFTLHMQAEADTVMRGANTWIGVTATGVRPEHVVLFVKESGSDRFTPFPVAFDTADAYRHLLPGISGSVQAFAFAEWNEEGVSSDTITVTVIDLPLIRSLQGRVIPPAYTQLPPTDFSEQQADITALPGSVVQLTVRSSKPLAEANIILETRSTDSSTADTVSLRMKVEGATAVGTFTVSKPGTYRIVLNDIEGQKNSDPMVHTIVVLTDGYPTITMVEPRKDVDIDATGRLPLLVSIADDYGFSRLTLHYKLVKSRYAMADKSYSTIPLPLQSGATALDVGYTWNLASLGITPDDEYEFFVEVADNDHVHGYKAAKTSTFKVRLPSLEEVFAETNRTQESLFKDLKKLAQETDQLRKESDELRREMQKQQAQAQAQTQWSDKRKAEELVKRQEDLQKRMDQMADKLEQMTQKLEQYKAISPETLDKYKELQELMRKVKSEELERMQRRLQEAMKQLTPEELERMMQNFTFDEEKFRQNIERTLNLLKRIQAEQKADELASRAEELARKQEDLAKQAENTNPSDKQSREKLAAEQQKLQEDLQQLANESKDLAEMMKDLGISMPNDQMKAALDELDADQTSADMKSAQQEMNKGNMQDARSKQKNASKNLQRFAQQMKQVKKQMNKNAQREAARQMQKGMEDMLDLSKQQEELWKQMRETDPSSSQFNQLAQKQQQLQEAMKNMANSMLQFSQRSMSVSPEMAQDMGDALQQMNNAIQHMQDRSGSMAQRSQQQAMSSMNSAAQRMSDALAQMMNGDGSGQGGQGQNPGMGQGNGQSPFQRLQQLAELQQQINNQMPGQGQKPGGQQQGADGIGGQLSQQQRAELGRLAAQQGRAMKAIQELEEERRSASGSKKPIGDLSQIASDMQEVMSDLQTGNITPETRLRQERILSRLLNASRSMNERDYEKTRESNSGNDVVRQGPPAIGLQLDNPAALRSLLDQVRGGFTKDYESLIRTYFEALQKLRLQPSQQ